MQHHYIFTSTLKCLAKIQNNSFDFNINDYIHAFYDSVCFMKYDLAGIMLDILKWADANDYKCMIITELEQQMKKIKNDNVAKAKNDTSLELIKSKLEYINTNSLIILRPKTGEEREHIHTIVNQIPGISSFEIGNMKKKELLLERK